MKSRRVTCIIVMTWLGVAMPVSLAAQDRAKRDHHGHHHYQLIDVGTFGGPNSTFIGFPPVMKIINNSGVAVGGTDTSTPEPSGPCFNQIVNGNADCYLSYGFKWQDGVANKLGALPGFNSSFPIWVSDNGLVAGVSENGIDPLTGSFAFEAVLWRKDGSIFDLGTLGGNDSIAYAVNNQSQVAGGALNTVPDPYAASVFFVPGVTQVHAFRWTTSEGMQDLGTLGGTDSFAFLINERGQIAGMSFTDTTVNSSTGYPTLDPFLWENGRMLDLGTLGGTFGQANGLNNRGQVVGFSNLAGDFTLHPFLWSKHEGMKDLGTLGGTFGHADFINDAGDVVGFATTADEQGRAFLWRHGVMINLGTLGADPSSESVGVNSQGQVVGGTFGPSGDLRAFLWEDGGPMIELNTLIPPNSGLQLTDATYINDHGEIAAFGLLSNGDIHAFILTPCDENHPGVEGCDYETIDAENAAARVNATPESRNAARLTPNIRMPRMSNGFHGVQQIRRFRSQTPDAKHATPINSSDDWTADHALAPLYGHHRGYCGTNSSGLTGLCAAYSYMNYCSVGRSSACPRGQKAKKPGYYRCALMQQIFVDLATSCAF